MLLGFVQVRAALVDVAAGVEHGDVFGMHAHALVEVGAGDGGCARAGDDHAHVFGLLAGDFERVHHARGGDDGGAVLVVVEDRDVHFFLEGFLNVEAFRGLDVFKVDAAKGRLHGLDYFDEFVGIADVEVDVEHVHVGEDLEEHALAFHDRLACGRADVAETQNGGAVGHHGHEVAARGVFKGFFGVFRDFLAGLGDARAVRHGQVLLRHAGLDGNDLDLSLASHGMVIERFLFGEECHCSVSLFVVVIRCLRPCGPARRTVRCHGRR